MKQINEVPLYPSIEDVLEKVYFANDEELNRIMDVVTLRYNRLFPDWEVLFLSVPKEPEERRKQLDQMLNQLKEGGLK